MQAKTKAIVKVTNMSKIINGQTILKNISFQLYPGRCYGLTGHNGAGKSMLLRVISGLVLPTSGHIIINDNQLGQDCEFAPDTGAIIDGSGFLPDYSGLDNLRILAAIRQEIGSEELKTVMEQVGLDPENPQGVHTYSSGMKQRLNIAQAIMENPRLLLLDEPTSAIDRKGISDIHKLLKQKLNNGVTILLISHSDEELNILCDDIFVMDKGHLLTNLQEQEPDFL